MLVILALAAVFVIIGFLSKEKRYRWIYILFKTLPRDIKAVVRFAKFNFYMTFLERNNMTVAKIFREVSKRQPHKVAYYFENTIWTFQKVEEYTNRIANYFKAEGYQKGDKVALLLESRPEYICIWLGLSKIGIVTALINTNLTHDPLLYSIQVANCKAIIFGYDFGEAIRHILPKLSSIKLYKFNEEGNTNIDFENVTDLKSAVENFSDELNDMEQGEPKDHLLYIYTSGTTGLPKAAVISNLRFMFMTLAMYFMSGLSNTDCIYDSLPLYHSAGGICGVGQALLHGVTVVIRKKFSASNFWKDCNKYKCTVAQYIGEICRYLLTVHSKEHSVKHSVRAMIGNGLKPQIWSKVVNNFGIKEIYEFYGSTEGNSNLINIDSTPGAVGFVPHYAKLLYPVALIKWDEKSGQPIRGGQGLCVRCKINEPGILVGKIRRRNAINQFTGYADQTETEKKILRNVFKTGDLYFNSGDLLVCDELGYYYFKDRTGDTFRWKGENVSTSEIEAIISNIVGFNDVIVYGVEIPGSEGRVGMAAIVDFNNSLNLEELCKGLKANLPAYAQPLFLRVIKSAPLTGTYKLIKRDLKEEGYNIDLVKDDLYFYDAKLAKYVKLCKDVYQKIVGCNVRV